MKKHLLDKYWNGETSLEEETWLKQNVDSFEEEMGKEDFAYLQQLKQFSNLSMEQEFDLADLEEEKAGKIVKVPFYKNIRKIAAAILILFTLSLATNSLLNKPVEEAIVEQSPEEAFEVAKQSLMLISSKLNKGIDCANEFGKFNKTHKKISK